MGGYVDEVFGSAKERMTKAANTLSGLPKANMALGRIGVLEWNFAEALHYCESARDGYAWIGDILIGLQQDRYNDAQMQIRGYRDELINLDNTRVKVGNVDSRKLQIEQTIRKLPLIKTPSPPLPRNRRAKCSSRSETRSSI